ncbi:adenine DNA glycosylase isoform X1 [Humulus lupulus]|uniref:adenine DNA glycosylase isoform X1 n=1 Tax=Humulus lupulus TaxID=3486 RepID=UPI002B402970|nr:adenine DNA glycosylase isoform X1 [Humulus lupulus]
MVGRGRGAAKEAQVDMEDLFSKTQIEDMRVSLLGWYGLNRRELPWRLAEDDIEKRTYRVWVSEVMLQQTRVQTVIDYFNRWILKWPTLHHLSQASLEEVNEMWAGLGYYRRARFLLEGAKMIVAEGGVFPKTVTSLLKVRGIGEYTAGAIASIAFKEVVPVVDGNVVRVIARLKAISANPKDSLTVKRFWELAAQLVDPFEPGDFNQGLMELGATVCTPTNPSCSSCPVSDHCRALSISRSDSSLLVTDYPMKGVKIKQRHDFSAVCVLEIVKDEDMSDIHLSDREFILVKRPDEGLLAGLWEFPSVLLDGEANLVTRRKMVDQYLRNNFGLDIRKTCKVVFREHAGEFVHIFSHIRLKIYAELLVVHLKGGMKDEFRKQEREALHWKSVDSNVIPSMGLTSSVKKVYTMVQKFKKQTCATNQAPSRKRIRSIQRN